MKINLCYCFQQDFVVTQKYWQKASVVEWFPQCDISTLSSAKLFCCFYEMLFLFSNKPILKRQQTNLIINLIYAYHIDVVDVGVSYTALVSTTFTKYLYEYIKLTVDIRNGYQRLSSCPSSFQQQLLPLLICHYVCKLRL